MTIQPSNSEAASETPIAASDVFTIYCHTHIESGRRYIGQTKKTWRKRWNRHVFESKHVKIGYGHFHNAIRKYGPDAFSHEVLEICHDLKSANAVEAKWIAHFHSNELEFGFNLTRGGSHIPHPVKNPWDRPGFREKHPSTIHHCFSPAARAAQRASLTPEKRSAATKAAMATPELQAKRAVFQKDPAYRARISAASKLALADPEVKARHSASAKIANARPEVKARVSAGIKAAFQKPEVQERHRAAVKEAQNRPEVRAKHAARVTSDETRAKISAASSKFRHTDESRVDMKRQFIERRDRLLAESGCATWSDYIRLSIKRKQSMVTS